MLEFENYINYLGPVRNCNLCDEKNNTEWGRRGIFKLVQCSGCGLVYINPRLNQTGLDKLYSNYFQGRAGNSKLTKMRNEMYHLEVDFLLKYLTDHRTILDIGCGGGGFLQCFPDNYNKIGTEYDATAAKETVKSGLKCYVGDFLDLKIIEKPIDVIIFRGTIEHVIDPKSTLEKASNILSKKGLLYITSTPNLNSVCAEIYRGNWNQFGPDHIYYFSEPILSQILKRNGLKLIADHHFYEETPYANYLSDHKQLNSDLQRLRNGGEITNISPPYWGNMLTLVYKKI